MAIAIRSVTVGTTAASATVSVTSGETPSATQVGDLCIVVHSNGFYAASNMPTPTATGSPTLNPISSGSTDGGASNAHIKSYWYVANTGGAQTVQVTETGTADEEKALALWVLSDADTATAIDVAGGTNAGSTAEDPWVLASISPTSSDAFMIGHVCNGADAGNAGAMAPPGGMIERYDTLVDAFYGFAGASEQLAASGATGTRTFDPTSSRVWGGVLMTVKTAVSVPAAPTIRTVMAARRLS